MVATCRTHNRRRLVRSRTHRPRYLRLGRLPDERRTLLRNETGRSFLHWSRPRQLGRRQRALCLAPFSRRGVLRKSVRQLISIAETWCHATVDGPSPSPLPQGEEVFIVIPS